MKEPNKPLSTEDKEKLKALLLVTTELQAKLTNLASSEAKSPHYEDLALDSCEYIAELILRKVKMIRGTDKKYRGEPDRLRSQ